MYQFSIKARRGYLHLAYLIYFFPKLDQNWDSKRLWPKPNLCQFDVIFGLDGKQTNFTVPEVSKIVIKFEPLRAGFQKKKMGSFQFQARSNLRINTKASCQILGKSALCVEMDFTQTFQASPKCNTINSLKLFLLGFGRFQEPQPPMSKYL